jgi:4-amino-4-deoxy-L-arabinose transferase-like glycosyltransferase
MSNTVTANRWKPTIACRIPSRRVLALILAASVLLRIAVACYLGNTFEEIRGGTHDQISYDALAQRVASGSGFSFARDWWPYARAGQPTAFWSYLYTGYLAAIYFVFGHTPLLARLLQALVVGVLTPLFLYRIAARTFNRRVGLLASAIAAVYLYFVDYAASLMTEASYITAILWTIDVVTRWVDRLKSSTAGQRRPQSRALLSYGLQLGLAMGITLLLRQVVLFFFLAMLLWLAWVTARQREPRALLAPFLLNAVVVAALLAPWIWRNHQVFGRLTLPNTNAGFTFFWSNHPIHGTHFEPVLSPQRGVSYQELIPTELHHLNEAELDRALLRRGLAFVTDDPRRYLLLSLSRIPVFFLFWPTADSSLLSNAARVLSFGLFLPFMVYGLALSALRAWQQWREDGLQALVRMSTSPRFLYWLFIVLYTAIHLASWANVRYRLPVDAFLILFASYGIDHLLTRYRHLWPKVNALAAPLRHSTGDDRGVQPAPRLSMPDEDVGPVSMPDETGRSRRPPPVACPEPVPSLSRAGSPVVSRVEPRDLVEGSIARPEPLDGFFVLRPCRPSTSRTPQHARSAFSSFQERAT